jgi:hypothetical protein
MQNGAPYSKLTSIRTPGIIAFGVYKTQSKQNLIFAGIFSVLPEFFLI